MAITFNNSVFATGFVGEDDGAASTGFSLDSTSANSITVNGTVTKVGDSVVATGLLPGSQDTMNTATTNTLYVTQFDNSSMIEFSTSNPPTSSSFRYVLSNTALGSGQRVTFTSDPALVNGTSGDVYAVTCFVSGTLIRTARSDVAVEDLRIGDLAVTASGATWPIIWIGQRTIECARHPRTNEVLPIRIAAHAFAENRPARDLVVSPGHSIAVDVMGEVLIPASSLINGTTIRQERVERVTYWHVELESHDLLVAENLPCESYLDMGNRGFFPQAGEAVALHGVPDAPVAAATHADFCRPFHANGEMVDFVRGRLAERALQLGWTSIDNTFADLHLVVDGQRLDPEVRGLSARFFVAAKADEVWLMSDTAVPAMVGGGADLRKLGVCVGKLVIDDGFGSHQEISADDYRLCVGFHHLENGPQRWTAGRARLPRELWDCCDGGFFLRIDLTRPALSQWMRPAAKRDMDEHVAMAG